MDSSQQVTEDELVSKGFKWTITFDYPRTQEMIPFITSKLVGSNIVLKPARLVAPSDWISGSFKLKID